MDKKTLTNIREMLASDIVRLETALAILDAVNGEDILDAYRIGSIPAELQNVGWSVENIVETCLNDTTD